MPEHCTAQEFVQAWVEAQGSPAAVARALDLDVTNVYARRRRLEARGWELPTTSAKAGNSGEFYAYKPRVLWDVMDGCAVVFSDRHWWPGDGVTPAEAALLALLQQLDPDAVIANGDVLDGARASKHPPLGWERKPWDPLESTCRHASLSIL